MTEQKPVTRVVRQLRSGQITIPAEFRKRLGITEDSLLKLTLQDGEIHIRPVEVADTSAGSPWLKELYDLFAPVREEAKKYSEEEINEAIDRAVKAVRQHNTESP